MYDFVARTHYVQLPVEKIAAILGWGLRLDTQDPHLVDNDGHLHWTLPMPGEDEGTIISLLPGHCMSRGAKQISNTFGDVALYDERFYRMWTFYLAGAAAAFRHGGMVNYQVQLTRNRWALPLTRDYMVEEERRLRGA